ncbi:Somatostatin Somatostatin-28 Somatostatin-14 Precursor [Channa argus]|uniref:Somatostatin Somatostatin-28 Somatostatin-14 n=1 Tax=Channa argus TaxID=215402 RepID=A0A6G1Q6D0_CHAAH|nr:Somatostatin Somatostatin-28 Somatostatin-14 Precursor [Channa argus]
MLRSQLQVLLVAFFSSVLLVQVSGAPHRDMQRQDLLNGKDITHLLNFVSELMVAKDQMLPELKEVVQRHLPLTQRERKAGCRSFFWKTFTSC